MPSRLSLPRLAALALACTAITAPAFATGYEPGRGINLGNALEAPREGAWSLTLEAGWFDIIADAGFDSVRVPIRWSAHAADRAPYTVEPSFFERIDWVLEQSRRTGLSTLINLHHYDELMRDPLAHEARFRGIWRQIAARYADRPDTLAFELLNEPHDAFDERPELWNGLFARTLEDVRRTNPSRTVVVGPVGYNTIDRLPDLRLPDDANLMATVHYYSPFDFTHQGASWTTDRLPTGQVWRGDTVSLGNGVQDWSWDVTLGSRPGALTVDYSRAWSAFRVQVAAPRDPTRLSLRLDGDTELVVGCSNGRDAIEWVERLPVVGDVRTTVSLDACPADSRQFALAGAVGGARLSIRAMTVCARDAPCERLVGSAGAAIGADLGRAKRWAEARDVPMYLGEFGAYGAGDMASRVRWTRSVRRQAERRGMPTAYWEFGAGFGAWDPATASWREPLRRALLD